MKLIKVVCFWVLCCLFANEGFAKALISFDYKNHNFGQIVRGQVTAYEFPFKNVGSSSLRIKGIYAECGCTVVELLEKEEYKPGETGFIRVAFHSENFSGSVKKLISVLSNSQQRANQSLYVQAEVREEFQVNPPLINGGILNIENSKAYKVQIKPIQGFDLKILGVEFDSKNFDVEWEQKGGYWDVTIVIKEGTAAGYLKDKISLKTNSRFLSTIDIPVRAMINGNILYIPDYVEFGVIESDQHVMRSVSFSGQKPFQMKHVSTEIFVNSSNFADVDRVLPPGEFTVKETGNDKRLEFQLFHPKDVSGSVRGLLKFETDDPKQKLIEINFYAFFK